MVLQRRFFTIQRIPILRYGYRDRFPLIDILQIPVAQLDVYEPVWEINGITFRRKIRIGIQYPFQSHIQTIQDFFITRIGHDIIRLRVICHDYTDRIANMGNII